MVLLLYYKLLIETTIISGVYKRITEILTCRSQIEEYIYLRLKLAPHRTNNMVCFICCSVKFFLRNTHYKIFVASTYTPRVITYLFLSRRVLSHHHNKVPQRARHIPEQSMDSYSTVISNNNHFKLFMTYFCFLYVLRRLCKR